VTSWLERFGLASRARAEQEMARRGLDQLEKIIETLPPVRPLAARLAHQAGPAPRMIAEMKRSSPTAGVLRKEYSPRQIAMGYARVGAAAVSVLTEPDQFGGDLSHLTEARASHLPVLRKDFLVVPYQIAQARVAGADAVLLIAALLQGADLAEMLGAARRYRIETLVEVHDEQDLGRTLEHSVKLVGINNRDLRSLEVDLRTCERLAPLVPPGVLRVAESGIKRRADIDRLTGSGFEAFLVGEQLMRAADPADELWRLTQPS